MRHQHPAISQRGFSIAELLVAVAIGLIILASLSTLFVKNMRTQDEIEKASRQVENGRFAVDQIGADLRNAGYYAEFDPTVLPAPAALPDPCATGLVALKAGLALPVQGVDNALLDCLPDQKTGTDAVVIRRTSTCVVGAAGCDPAAGAALFQASLCNNPAELDSANPDDYYALDTDSTKLLRHKRDCTQVAGSGTLADVRRYLVHIYYIANNNRAGDHVPTLMRAELADSGSGLAFSAVPLAEGIENLQLEYGMDLAPAGLGDGVADQFSANPASWNGCALNDCAIANWRSVVSVKLHLLARNTLASAGYRDDKKSYKLGKDANGDDITIGPSGDPYRRHVFQSLVAIPNTAGRRIP